MKVQIVDDNGQVLYVPSANRYLEQELGKHLAGSAPWYRPVKRRWARDVERRLIEATDELRALTHLPVGEPPRAAE